MEMLKYEDIYCFYFKQGLSKNGNSIYCLQFFKKMNDEYKNINSGLAGFYKFRLDKQNNIKITSCNILYDIKHYIGNLGK